MLCRIVHSGDSTWRELRDTRGRTIGLAKIAVTFAEDRRSLLYSMRPRLANARAADDLTVETVKRYVERVQAIVAWLLSWTKVYQRIMSWENPVQTAICLVGFL